VEVAFPPDFLVFEALSVAAEAALAFPVALAEADLVEAAVPLTVAPVPVPPVPTARADVEALPFSVVLYVDVLATLVPFERNEVLPLATFKVWLADVNHAGLVHPIRLSLNPIF
jgi:hypothetical protein